MHTTEVIFTNNAPEPIGPYSQAIKVGNTVYLSGQIGLLHNKLELVSKDFKEQAKQVFKNLSAVAKEAGGSLSDVVKLNVYVKDFVHFHIVNDVMRDCFSVPYPARAALEVADLPMGALIEVDAVLILEN